MRASRLLAILIMLKGKGRLTAQTLAERFEVSRRTIYRDLDELAAAGVPIIADRGVGGGIALGGNYQSDFSALTPKERQAFVFSELTELASHLGMAGEAASAKAKIVDSLGENAALISSRFHFDPSDWYRKIGTPVHLQVLTGAVLENRSIEFDYVSWKGFRRHQGDPVGLVTKSGVWYCLIRKRKRFLIFRIDMMSNLFIAKTQFQYPAEFDLEKTWRKSVSQFETELFAFEAEVIVRPGAMTHLARLGDKAANIISNALPGLDGCRSAVIPIESYANFAREVLWFTGDLQVVAPDDLVRQIRDIFNTLKSNWED